MIVNTDHYFTGKNRHRPCEDYAISGSEPVPYVILADGCSSSPGSHMGAMFLCLAARRQMQQNFGNGRKEAVPDYEALGRAIIRRAARLSWLMNLPETSLDATLMAAFVADDTIFVYVYGDGFVMARRRGETGPRVAEIRFETNAPFYLSYLLDQDRKRQYGLEMDGAKIIQSDGESLSVRYDAPVCYQFPAEEFSLVALASDGLASFVNTQNPAAGLLPAGEVIREFTAFKNFNGAFIKRRAKRAVSTYEKRSVVNTDDISVAAIYTEEEPS